MRRLIFGWAIAGIAALSPALAFAGDQEVAQQIASNLKNSGKLKGYSISVKVHEGIVQLDGTVRSEKQLADALEIAEITPGIEQVINNLSVKAPTVQTAAPTLRQPRGIVAEGNRSSSRASKVFRPTVSSAVRKASAEFEEIDSLETPAPEASPDMISESGLDTDAPPQMPAAAPVRGRAPRAMAMAPRNVHRASANIPNGAYPQMARMSRQEVVAPGCVGPNCPVGAGAMGGGIGVGAPGAMPAYAGAAPMGAAAGRYDQPQMPGYAWPSYAAYPNYAALTYPKQYSPTAWPFIGPFYPYPQVPLGWRKVSLEWDNGWWMLDFKDSH